MKRYLITKIGISGLIILFIAVMMGAEYDSSGVLGVLYWASYLFSLPFQFGKELLFSTFGGESNIAYDVFAAIFQIGLCYLADAVKIKIGSRQKSNNTNKR